jgi:hypothetical protein
MVRKSYVKGLKRPKDFEKRRVSALTETQRMLEKEMSYPKNLRKKNRVKELNAHINRLIKMK